MKKILILLLTSIFLISGCSIKKTEELSSSEKFAAEYSINEDNPFKYTSYSQVKTMFNAGSGLIFLGNSDSEWSVEAAKNLYYVLKEKDIDLIYYLNPTRLDSKDRENLYKIILDKIDDDKILNVSLPCIFILNDGEIVRYSMNEVYKEYTNDEQDEISLKEIYEGLFEDYLE